MVINQLSIKKIAQAMGLASLVSMCLQSVCVVQTGSNINLRSMIIQSWTPFSTGASGSGAGGDQKW